MRARSVTKDDFIEERIEQHQQQLNDVVKDRRPGRYQVANELFDSRAKKFNGTSTKGFLTKRF